MRIARERDKHMLRRAELLQCGCLRVRMARTHRDHELLLVERLCGEARWEVAKGNDGNIERTRLQIGKGELPGTFGRNASKWRQKLPQADIDAWRGAR